MGALETMPTMTMMCLISWRTLTHAAKPNPSAQVRKRPTAWKQTRKTQRSKWCGSPQTFSHTLQKSKYFTVSKKRRRNQDFPKSSLSANHLDVLNSPVHFDSLSIYILF